MITNQFAYFKDLASLYNAQQGNERGVSANKENTRRYDINFNKKGSDMSPLIPFDTICFIEKPFGIFTHGKFMPFSGKTNGWVNYDCDDQNHLSYDSTVSTQITIDGEIFLKPNDGEYLLVPPGARVKADSVINTLILFLDENNKPLQSNIDGESYNEHRYYFYKNNTEATKKIIPVCKKGSYTESDIFARVEFKTQSLFNLIEKADKNAKKGIVSDRPIIVHRGIPKNPQIGERYYYENISGCPYITLAFPLDTTMVGSRRISGEDINAIDRCSYGVLVTISQDMIKCNAQGKNEIDLNYIATKLSTLNYIPVGSKYDDIKIVRNLNAKTASPYFEISNGKIICVKKLSPNIFNDKKLILSYDNYNINGNELQDIIIEYKTITKPSYTSVRRLNTPRGLSFDGNVVRTLSIKWRSILRKDIHRHTGKNRIKELRVTPVHKGIRSIHSLYFERVNGNKDTFYLK